MAPSPWRISKRRHWRLRLRTCTTYIKRKIVKRASHDLHVIDAKAGKNKGGLMLRRYFPLAQATLVLPYRDPITMINASWLYSLFQAARA